MYPSFGGRQNVLARQRITSSLSSKTRTWKIGCHFDMRWNFATRLKERQEWKWKFLRLQFVATHVYLCQIVNIVRVSKITSDTCGCVNICEGNQFWLENRPLVSVILEWSRGLRWGYFGSKLPTTWSKKTFPEGVAGVVLIDGWMDVTNVTNVSSFVHPLVVWKLKFSLDRGDPRIKGTERNPTKHQQRYQTKVNSKLNFFWMPK